MNAKELTEEICNSYGIHLTGKNLDALEALLTEALEHKHNSLCEGCVKFTAGLYEAVAKKGDALHVENEKLKAENNAIMDKFYRLVAYAESVERGAHTLREHTLDVLAAISPFPIEIIRGQHPPPPDSPPVKSFPAPKYTTTSESR